MGVWDFNFGRIASNVDHSGVRGHWYEEIREIKKDEKQGKKLGSEPSWEHLHTVSATGR